MTPLKQGFDSAYSGTYNEGVMMAKDNPNKHDGTRDGEGIYQPGKTEKPKDYGGGKHDKDNPKKN